MSGDRPVVSTYTVPYIVRHFHEVLGALRRGDVVRIIDLRSGAEEWVTMTAGPPAGVVPDLTAARAVRKRRDQAAANGRARWRKAV
jgi:hypothetical protein